MWVSISPRFPFHKHEYVLLHLWFYLLNLVRRTTIRSGRRVGWGYMWTCHADEWEREDIWTNNYTQFRITFCSHCRALSHKLWTLINAWNNEYENSSKSKIMQSTPLWLAYLRSFNGSNHDKWVKYIFYTVPFTLCYDHHEHFEVWQKNERVNESWKLLFYDKAQQSSKWAFSFFTFNNFIDAIQYPPSAFHKRSMKTMPDLKQQKFSECNLK